MSLRRDRGRIPSGGETKPNETVNAEEVRKTTKGNQTPNSKSTVSHKSGRPREQKRGGPCAWLSLPPLRAHLQVCPAVEMAAPQEALLAEADPSPRTPPRLCLRLARLSSDVSLSLGCGLVCQTRCLREGEGLLHSVRFRPRLDSMSHPRCLVLEEGLS